MRAMVDKSLFHNIEDAFIKIGYKRNLIKSNYQYADLFSVSAPIRAIEYAIFGQEPLDYRSACFGIQTAKPNFSSDVVVNELRALGAPQILIIHNGTTERWAITEKEPLLQDKYKTAQLPDIVIKNVDDWNPKAIIRAKSGFSKPSSRQMDFVDIGLIPALEHEAAKKIDSLLSSLLHQAEEEFKKHKHSFDASVIFRVVFSLLAAKLLKDRAVINSSAINFSDPQSALNAVSSHYGASLNITTSIPVSTLYSISQEIGRSFSLKNISVDTLTYVYENTFVSKESRKELGIHSTPSFVADYLLSQLPLDDMPKSLWHTLDPMCGHGILLIAAMRRMRDLLPPDWGGKRRHNFFIEHLHGIEIDPFSVEVARMCLMLADFPESNGWDINKADAFDDNMLEESSTKNMILVANPPFEKIKIDGKTVPKPLEFLRRTLHFLPEEALIGLILPRSFLDSSTYKEERKYLINNFEINTITTLPDKIFLHSEAETAIVSAKKKSPLKLKCLVYREVRDAHREAFKIRCGFTWQEKISQSYFDNTRDNRLVVPLLKELWDRLESYPCFEEIIISRTGIRYKKNIPLGELIRNSESPDYRKGFFNVNDDYYQYVANDAVYMSLKKEHIKNAAWKYNWDIPKIILPVGRMARGPWRFAAAIDTDGRVVSRSFYAIWPKMSSSVSVYTIAALLNSPIAQAFVYSNVSDRNLLVKTYGAIPIPKLENLQQSDQIISKLVKSYIAEVETNQKQAYNTLLKIDSEVLKLYELTPKLERQLLDIFWGQERPIPFEFKGYIPPEMISWIPLHIYISTAFKEGTLEKVMSRIPTIKDKEFIEYLKNIGTE